MLQTKMITLYNTDIKNIHRFVYDFFFILIFGIICCCALKCPLNGISSSDYDKCFYFFSPEQDFTKAERACEEMGRYLVSVCNAFENNLIQSKYIYKQFPCGFKNWYYS